MKKQSDYTLFPMAAETCSECGKEVKVQIFKNTGVCSENCRKDRDNDHEPARLAT